MDEGCISIMEMSLVALTSFYGPEDRLHSYLGLINWLNRQWTIRSTWKTIMSHDPTPVEGGGTDVSNLHFCPMTNEM